VVSPSEACFADGADVGLIGESASARSLVAADSISIAAAARLKERTRPRLESGIFIMRETPRIRQRKPRESQGRKTACPRHIHLRSPATLN
jgi:hypothetical protein